MRRLLPICLATVIVTVGTACAEEAARPLSLPEAIRLALQQNPDIATVQQRVKAAQAGLQQADSALMPHVRVSESYAASDNPVQAFMMTLNQRTFSIGNANFNHPGTTDNLNTKLLAQWSLYDGGQSLANRQAAKLNTEAAGQSLDAARNDLVFEVTRAYHTIGKARQFYAAAEAAVTSMAANVNVASNRVAAGQSLKTDFLDAQVRLAEARETRIRTRNAVALSETIFRNVLGTGEKDNVTAAESQFVTAPETGATDFTQRPELAAMRKALAAASRQVRAAQGGHIPRLNAFASYDIDSGDARRFEDSWVAGASVELDVFDGFLTHGKVNEARANLAAMREQLRKTELLLEFETQQARLNLHEATARLDTTAQSVAQAEESLTLTKERYGNGLALLTQVLDSETALTGARQRRAAAEADYLIARAALDRALGKTWKEQ